MHFSERIYRLLLKAYPERYRRRYEEPMAQLFSDQLRAAHTPREWAVLWLRTLADFVRTLPARHAERQDSVYGLKRVDRPSFHSWTPTARYAIFLARQEASSYCRREITAEHLLAGILRQDREIPELAGVREILLKDLEADEAAPRRTPPMEDLPISRELVGILSLAKIEASRSHAIGCTNRHLLAAILGSGQARAARLLLHHGVKPEWFAAAR